MTKQIKSNLAFLRFAHGRLSQKAVSEATGVGQKTLSALETGASKGIEFSTLIKLCTFFQCTPSDLLIIEDVNEVPLLNDSREKAKQLVARGLQSAMETPPADPEQIWAKFDAVRKRIQDASIETEQEATNRITKRA